MLSHFKTWLIWGLAWVALTLGCQWAFDHLIDRLTK